jgi:hypothetical protein
VPLSNLPNPLRGGDHGGEVGSVQGRLDVEEVQHVAVLGALRFAPQQPLGAAHPARADHLIPRRNKFRAIPIAAIAAARGRSSCR